MSAPIRYLFQQQVREVTQVSPTRTLLQHLREDLHCTGTKEGCAEGDCGACTVVVGELLDGKVEMKSVNACLQFLPAIDGKAVFTVEDVQQAQQLHPVQQALVECHASQCGFCTPGFVMSLWDLYLQREESHTPLNRNTINIALSGNLCRCTGYRPIIAAAHRMEQLPRVKFNSQALAQQLGLLKREDSLRVEHADQRFDAPQTLQELLELRAAHPGAVLLAGGTDIGLWVTKQFRALPHLISLGKVRELQSISEQSEILEIGAAVTLDRAYQHLCKYYPNELGELAQRFASLPIRHAGTLGGNVANGSPIGDSMPWLIALGAQIVLSSLSGQRHLALEDFYLAYQKKDLRADEIVSAIRIPLPELPPQSPRLFRTYKLAKRYDQDISAVCAAFSTRLVDNKLQQVRIAYGGMAATPKRATQAELALEGQPWDEAHLQAAITALANDYQPLSDMRASAEYRLLTAQNLLKRFWLETRAGLASPATPTNVFAVADQTEQV
ncbi:xanthine dehydrogenase small subunit [Undibacterium curvum]|uniref:Xanthine dehydrogenase small subunit n=1 Tax=Undibacterium curvum TaxID=2762294 RepID=A0ABR7A6N3_9BURK|nr:xanthine dehydrogenase small subunit [Undibacterium curvum]MBC3932558.1 xanthine dehydrogenase small subunit [Undibacterium curvum]